MNGTSSKSPKLDPIFEALAPSKEQAAQSATLEELSTRMEGQLARVAALTEDLTAPAHKPAGTPAKPVAPAANHLEAVGREIAKLATHPSTKVSGPVAKGIGRALDQQAKLDAKLAEAKQLRSPKAKLEVLKAAKHDALVEANEARQKRCAEKRDEILANMRARCAGKK